MGYGDLLCWDELCSLRAPATGPTFRAWLAFSSGGPSCNSAVPEGWPLVELVHHRIDQVVLGNALSPLSSSGRSSTCCGRLRAVVSGPEGFFETMRDMFQASARELTTFVN